MLDVQRVRYLLFHRPAPPPTVTMGLAILRKVRGATGRPLHEYLQEDPLFSRGGAGGTQPSLPIAWATRAIAWIGAT